MQTDSLLQLYVDELRDLYSAEMQVVRTLPRLAKVASSPELKAAFEEHLRQTSDHVSRLEQIFKSIDQKPSGRKCLGMRGLVKESVETMEEEYEPLVMDAALIGVAQRVEHYEIAGYGTVRAFGKLLGENDHVSLIEQTLTEKKQTDQTLSQLAEQINSQAAQSEKTPGHDRPPERKNSSSRAA